MSIPVFTQVDSTPAYALSTLAEAGLNGYWAGYFAGSSGNLGASASTTIVWRDTGGFYLFLDKTPTDWTSFAAELSALRSAFDPQNNARFVWLGNADKSSLQWNITVINAGFSGSGASIVWTQLRAVAFAFGEYIFSLNGLSVLSYITDSNGGGIGFSGGGSFAGPASGYNFSSAQISFSGLALGAFSGTMPVPAPANSQQTDLWTALNIGLQYAAAPVPVSSDEDSQPVYEASLSYAGATQILFMPVFTRQAAALSLGISFDPFNLLNSARTVFSLFPPGASQLPTLDSYMRTTRGYVIQLKPLAASGQIPAAQFVFGSCPVSGSTSAAGNSYHLSPDGAFQINIKNPETLSEDVVVSNLVMLGLSGLEYANLVGTDYMVVFQGSQPAFVPAVEPSGAKAPDVSQALTNIATTSYLNVLAHGGENQKPVYYAQPREAPVFSGQVPRTDGILNFNPIPAATLGYTSQQRPPVFPVGIYAGLTSEQAELAREIENSSLAPFRNYCIGNAYGPGAPSPKTKAAALAPQRRVRSENDPLGVTPQGLVAELTPDYQNFDGLIIGNMPNTNYPTVDLTAVAGKFKQTLLSNQLFFVASNVDVLMSGTSVRYQLTEADKPYLLALNVPQSVIDAVYQAVSSASQPFPTEGQFVTCIQSAAGVYLACFLYIGGILKVEMDGWAFQLSPRTWRTDAKSPTMMIAKFCNRSLIDLANDSSSWNWPEAATLPGSWNFSAVSNPPSGWTYPGTTNPQTISVEQTQTILLEILNAAGAPEASAAQRIFYETVASDPNWNGFLFLNAPVAIGEFPEDLKFLTAGIDLTKFYAHHVGFSQTPFTVQNGQPQLQQTAAFGLIDYEDAMDLYSTETIPFGFKTMRLRARFANAALVDFSAEVELMLNQLLGSILAKSDAARGNNLIIDGSYQRVGGAPMYAFTLTGQNLFNANDSAVVSIEVLSVQLVNGGNPGSVNVLTTFILNGNLRFVRYEDFDLFSYGPGENDIDGFLRYSGLSIDMSFSMVTPTVQTFVVRESNTTFDMGSSVPRPSSLIDNFPLTVTALVASPNLSAEGEKPTGQTPEEMGYVSISAPIDQTPMVTSWYGLVFTLDLGTFGALTGSVSFKIGILAAWSRGASQDSFPVYLGLKLPGISAIAGSFPLQGVLKLGFRSFQFKTYDDNGRLAYLLRMRRFALSVLVWSFPPGNADLVLFGQPNNPKGSLGWYAAYDDGKTNSSSENKSLSAADTKALESGESADEKALDPVQRRLKSGRRKQRIG